MEKRKSILRILSTFAIASILLTSCLEETEPPVLDFIPDVFVQKITDNGVESYALVFWAIGNKVLETVTVEGPLGETWDLEQDPNNYQVFSLFPEEADYSDLPPESGTYEFTASSTEIDELPVTLTDELEDTELEAVVIDSVKYENSRTEIYWQALTGVDSHIVKLYDESDNLLFISPEIASSETDYAFGTSDQGWTDISNKASAGEIYKIEILGILYESSAVSNQDYNIQYISMTSQDIVWGE